MRVASNAIEGGVGLAAGGDSSPLVARITAPKRVIHGHADTPAPLAAAHHLGGKITGTVGGVVPGIGHLLPPQLLSRFADGIDDTALRGPSQPGLTP